MMTLETFFPYMGKLLVSFILYNLSLFII